MSNRYKVCSMCGTRKGNLLNRYQKGVNAWRDDEGFGFAIRLVYMDFPLKGDVLLCGKCSSARISQDLFGSKCGACGEPADTCRCEEA